MASNPVAEVTCEPCEVFTAAGGGGQTGFDGTTPEIYLELQSSGMGASGYWYRSDCTPWETWVPLDTADYDGDCTFVWEVVWQNVSTVDKTLRLMDTDGNEYATVTMPARTFGTDALDFFKTRVSFTPYSGVKTYCVKYPGGLNAQDLGEFITACRIVIRQTGATKTIIQIPLLCFPDWCIGSPSGNDPVAFGEWVYNAVYPGVYSNKFALSAGDPTPYYGYSNDFLQVWKYDATELATVTSVRIDAIAGQELMARHDGPQNATGAVAGDAVVLGIYEENGGVYTLVAGSQTSYTYPNFSLTYSVILSNSSFTDGKDYYIGQTLNGDPITYHFFLTWYHYISDPAESVSKIVWETGLAGFYLRTYVVPAGTHSLSLCLWDRTAAALVTGTELVWGATEWISIKTATIAGSVLVSGHEYEMRAKTDHTSYADAPVLTKFTMYLTVNPITRLTVWQRVGIGNQFMYWGYADEWGAEYACYGDGVVGSNNPVTAFVPSWASSAYEITGTFYDGFDEDIECRWQGLWSRGTDTSGAGFTWNQTLEAAGEEEIYPGGTYTYLDVALYTSADGVNFTIVPGSRYYDNTSPINPSFALELAGTDFPVGVGVYVGWEVNGIAMSYHLQWMTPSILSRVWWSIRTVWQDRRWKCQASGQYGPGLVANSEIAWVLAESQNGNERIQKRSDCLSLINGYEYVDMHPDTFVWLYPVQGFIVNGNVAGCAEPPPPPVVAAGCRPPEASIVASNPTVELTCTECE